jgi:hypothetical protein
MLFIAWLVDEVILGHCRGIQLKVLNKRGERQM